MKSALEKTVEKINETIVRQLRCKTGNEFPVRTFGIAFPVQIMDGDTESSIPAIVLNDGECHYVFSDDDYPVGLYHRLVSKSYAKAKGYGDGDLDIETDDVSLIVWGFSNRLNMSPVEFEREIVIPSIPKSAVLVSSDFDSHRVIGGEFRNVNYVNRPEEFILSVKYRIQFKFDRICALEKNCS
ncbi:MAG: hypothetical protein LBL07_00460 [Tannerella sp.]|jgi:hypothetical protein|nr:hypothetical protein [Tannerella sp.]